MNVAHLVAAAAPGILSSLVDPELPRYRIIIPPCFVLPHPIPHHSPAVQFSRASPRRPARAPGDGATRGRTEPRGNGEGWGAGARSREGLLYGNAAAPGPREKTKFPAPPPPQGGPHSHPPGPPAFTPAARAQPAAAVVLSNKLRGAYAFGGHMRIPPPPTTTTCSKTVHR